MSEHEQFGRADAVFVGRVASVSANHAAARFSVRRVRTGEARKGSIVLVTADPYPSSVTIAWRPRRGQRWWIYAEHRGTRWTTTDCHGTRRVLPTTGAEGAPTAHVVRPELAHV